MERRQTCTENKQWKAAAVNGLARTTNCTPESCAAWPKYVIFGFMQAVRVHQNGGPEQLRVEDIALPEPRAGEVRIRVEAVGR